MTNNAHPVTGRFALSSRWALLFGLFAASSVACGAGGGTRATGAGGAAATGGTDSGSNGHGGFGGAGSSSSGTSSSSSSSGQASSSSGGSSSGGASSSSSASGSSSSSSSGALAATPYMGWSSWSTFEEGVDETIVKASADAVANQLLSYGYTYINIDDGWYNGYDAYGRLKPDSTKFPDGISGVATYVHSKGLKLGIYRWPGLDDAVYTANAPIYGTTYHAKDIVSNPSAAGNTSKAATQSAKLIDYTKPGAIEYIESYADLFASWGVDFVKMDFVGPGGGGGNANNEADIQQWRAALDKSGRQIWLELSNQLGIGAIATWKAYSNGWRIQTDVECYCATLTNWEHVVRNINSIAPWVSYGGPGGWNDMDSTEIGNGSHDGITVDERTTMFSFWAISAAPIYLGSDVRSLDPTDLTILTNSEVIAVDQAGIPAKPVSTATSQQVWYVKNTDGSFIVGLFNLGASTATVNAKWSDVGAGSSMQVRDLWSHTDLGAVSTSFSASIPTHGTRLLKLTP